VHGCGWQRVVLGWGGILQRTSTQGNRGDRVYGNQIPKPHTTEEQLKWALDNRLALAMYKHLYPIIDMQSARMQKISLDTVKINNLYRNIALYKAKRRLLKTARSRVID